MNLHANAALVATPIKHDDRFALPSQTQAQARSPSWREMADERWGLEIHKYYGQEPFLAASRAVSKPVPIRR